MFIDNIVDALRSAGAINVSPFNYSFQWLDGACAAGSSTQRIISIQADSDFVAKYMALTAYDSPNHTVATVLAPLTLGLLDTGSGRNLMDNAQSIQNLCGGAMSAIGGSGGSAPFIFAEPLLIRASSTVQATLTNLTSPLVTTGGRTFQRVEITLHGYKIFELRKPGANEVWYYPVGGARF